MFTNFYQILFSGVPTSGIARCQTYLIAPNLNACDEIAKSHSVWSNIFFSYLAPYVHSKTPCPYVYIISVEIKAQIIKFYFALNFFHNTSNVEKEL